MKCEYCGVKPSERLLCSRCRRVAYCNVECQRAHWKTHKTKCVEDSTKTLIRAGSHDVVEVSEASYERKKIRTQKSLQSYLDKMKEDPKATFLMTQCSVAEGVFSEKLIDEFLYAEIYRFMAECGKKVLNKKGEWCCTGSGCSFYDTTLLGVSVRIGVYLKSPSSLTRDQPYGLCIDRQGANVENACFGISIRVSFLFQRFRTPYVSVYEKITFVDSDGCPITK